MILALDDFLIFVIESFLLHETDFLCFILCFQQHLPMPQFDYSDNTSPPDYFLGYFLGPPPCCFRSQLNNEFFKFITKVKNISNLIGRYWLILQYWQYCTFLFNIVVFDKIFECIWVPWQGFLYLSVSLPLPISRFLIMTASI